MAGSYQALEKATVLVVDDNTQALEIVAGVLMSFGVRNILRASDGLQAKDIATRQVFDLVLTDAQMPGMDGYDFVRWLRREGPDALRVVPAIVVTAHTRRSEVMRARDCGANFIVAKPLTPKVLLQRITWVARGDRQFIECDTYFGPDRRYKHEGPPPDFPNGRRRDDVPIEIGAPAEPNLSQDVLDPLVKPQKVSA
ncbi:MAG: response regulator [Phenylobacterium sp.]|uniref:response regulator n=1 Tax=Phenylobacterium sp. TaxID=1871053 RepID=UPI00391AA545